MKLKLKFYTFITLVMFATSIATPALAIGPTKNNYIIIDAIHGDDNPVSTMSVISTSSGVSFDNDCHHVTAFGCYAGISPQYYPSGGETITRNELYYATAFGAYTGVRTHGTAIGYNSVAYDYATALGSESYANNNYATAVGYNSRTGGDRAVALGAEAYAGHNYAVALGGNANVSASGGVAIGARANTEGGNSISMGVDASSSGDNSIALGTAAKTTNGESVAIGTNASATNAYSVALGSDSVTSMEYEVSIGSDSVKRRLTNLADAVNDSDAVTLGQIKNAGGLITMQESGNYYNAGDSLTAAIGKVDTQLYTTKTQVDTNTENIKTKAGKDEALKNVAISDTGMMTQTTAAGASSDVKQLVDTTVGNMTVTTEEIEGEEHKILNIEYINNYDKTSAGTKQLDVTDLIKGEIKISGSLGTIETSNGIKSTVTKGEGGEVNVNLYIGENFKLEDSLTKNKTEYKSTGVIVSSGDETMQSELSSGLLSFKNGDNSASLSTSGLSINNKTYVSSAGLNANSQKITGVADGEVGSTSKDAVNGSQLYNRTTMPSSGNYYSEGDSTIDAISKIDAQMSEDKEAIDKNKDDIEQNKDDIEQNKKDIDKNTDDIEQNKKDIEQNTKDIADNKKEIEQNSKDIADHKDTIDTKADKTEALKTVTWNSSTGSMTETTVEGVTSEVGKLSDSAISEATLNSKTLVITSKDAYTGTVTTTSVDLSPLEIETKITVNNYTFKGDDKNITVTTVEDEKESGHYISTIKLSEDLTDISSISTKADSDGKKTVLSNSGLSVANGASMLDSTKLKVGNSSLTTDTLTVGNTQYITSNGINAAGKKITNVSNGEVNSTSKDAVNGSQLYSATTMTTNGNFYKNGDSTTTAITNLDAQVSKSVRDIETNTTNIAQNTAAIETKAGKDESLATVAVSGTGMLRQTTVANKTTNVAQLCDTRVQNMTLTTQGSDKILTVYLKNNYTGKIIDSNSVNVTDLVNTHVEIKGSLGNVTTSNGIVSTKNEYTDPTTGEKKVDIDLKIGEPFTITDTSNKDYSYYGTGNMLASNADKSMQSNLTYGQLSFTSGSNTTTLSTDGLTINNKTYVSDSGLNANGQKVTNVADGTIAPYSKDAVNGAQMYEVYRMLKNTGAVELNEFRNAVTNMGKEIEEVGAIGAALSGLHFMEPVEGEKLSAAVSYGGYRGESAMAVGLAYKPWTDVMLTASTTFGASQDAYNAGLAFRIGPRDKKDSKTAAANLARQIESVNEENQKLKQENVTLNYEVQQQKSEIRDLKLVVASQGEQVKKLLKMMDVMKNVPKSSKCSKSMQKEMASSKKKTNSKKQKAKTTTKSNTSDKTQK